MTQVESIKSFNFKAVYQDGHSTSWMPVLGETRTIWDTLEPMLTASKQSGFRPDPYKSYSLHHFEVYAVSGDDQQVYQVTPKFIRGRIARLNAEWEAIWA